MPKPAVATPSTSDTGPTTFFDDRPLDLPSPDGRYRLVTITAADDLKQLVAVRTSDGQGQPIAVYEPPTAVLWSPSSESFFVNDQKGSGQSSYLEVVRLEQGRFRRDLTARRNLNRLFNRLFECRLSDTYINTSGESWFDALTIVVDVQASLHSGGCALDPFADNRVSLLVNARTGAVLHRRIKRP